MRNEGRQRFVVLALILALVLWSPWLTTAYVERRVIQEFSSAWDGVVDGCGFDCEGCGVIRVSRLTFGYSVEIEYACGLLALDSSEFHLAGMAYVSPLGTVHGLPGP
jgi:hypothetical protein